MRWKSKLLCLFATANAVSLVGNPALLMAGDFYKPFRFLKQPFEAAHREKPNTAKDDGIEHLAKEIDWLEHHIDKYGSIVAKHPDIWGQSRLMRHRYEYEREMQAQIEQFEVRMNGALRRSDQAFLGMAFALQSATGTRTTTTNGVSTTNSVPIPNPTESNTILTSLNAMVPTTNSDGVGNAQIIQRTQPFATATQPLPSGFTFNNDKLSLEPTTQLDQMSRYLNHLHELRRINEGDDIADSPGYSLNLVRIPVSITPGKQTLKGYGAEITITAEPYLSDDLLPVTMRNMVINDAIDLLAPVLTFLANDDEVREIVEKGKEDLLRSQETPATTDAATDPLRLRPTTLKTQSFLQLSRGVPDVKRAETSIRVAKEIGLRPAHGILVTTAATNTNARRARMPIPTSQVGEVMGNLETFDLLVAILDRFQEHPANQPLISYVDVRSYLHEELEASYDFLKGEAYRSLWRYSEPQLANLIRERRLRSLNETRAQFFNEVCTDKGQGLELSKCNSNEDCGTLDVPEFPICKQVTARLAWAIIVESALLSERLHEDMREAATAKGCNCVPDQCGPLYGPDPSFEARQAFNTYVRCRWPVRVFALDPVTQDQNIADAFARRREMQVAIALAFASGQINSQAMMRYTRRLEWDMATININQTAVGFSHGNDTFGWRFHPRFQSPPIKGTLATFGETLLGGPTTNSDLRVRHLEPGMRECTAIVVMPSFVPYMTFDVRTNWFKLTNPKCTEISMEETMTLSRSIQSMKQNAANCGRCEHLYREGEVHRLLKRVDQLDRELPLQTMQAQIPYENTSGGFELFNTGITDLAPELVGWYGAPGVNPSGPTTLYLIGKGFSVHSTQLIAGARNLPFTLISRQVMQVEVPAGVQVLKRVQDGEGRLDELVDIHLATPYGVSGHLLVPVAKEGAQLRNVGSRVAWRSREKLKLNAKVGTASPKTITMGDSYQSSASALLVDVPSVAPSANSIIFNLNDAVDGTFLGTFKIDTLPFDSTNNAIVIAGSKLNDLAGTGGSPTNLGLLVKNYLTWHVNNQTVPGKQKQLILTGLIDLGAGRQPIVIENGIEVEVNFE